MSRSDLMTAGKFKGRLCPANNYSIDRDVLASRDSGRLHIPFQIAIASYAVKQKRENPETADKGLNVTSIVVALLALVGTIITAFFAFRGSVVPVEMELAATAQAQFGGVEAVAAEPNLVRLTNSPGNEISGSFSPDGLQVVYIGDVDGNQNIYSMTADGLLHARHTDTEQDEDTPSFSPDGQKIIFGANYDSNSEIYLLHPDGSQSVTNVSNMPDSDEGRARFTAGGGAVVFDSNITGDWEVFTANFDGSRLTSLANLSKRPEHHDRYPVVSTLGARVYFRAGEIFNEPDARSALYSVRLDGADLRQVTLGPNDRYPTVSADEEWMVFQSERDGNRDIYALHILSGEVSRLTTDPADDSFPSLSTDGQWIIFSSNRSNTGYDIYKMPFSP